MLLDVTLQAYQKRLNSVVNQMEVIKMKKFSLILVGVFLLGSPAIFAGHGHGDKAKWGDDHVEKKLDRLSKDLDISKDQRSQLEGIMKSHQEKMKKLREEYKSQLKSVLNDEQQKKFEKMKEKRHSKYNEKRKKKRKE